MLDNRAFEIARESITAEQAAIYYGLKVNNQHRATCPFHNGKNNNLSFHGGGYCCFVCGEKGDVTRYVQTLFGYARPYDALTRLDDDFRLGLDLHSKKPPQIDTGALKAVRRKTAARELPEWAQGVLWEYELNLSAIKERFAPTVPDYTPTMFMDFWEYSLHWTDYAWYLLNCFPIEPDAQITFTLENIEQLKKYEKFNAAADKVFTAFNKGGTPNEQHKHAG